MLTTQKSPSNQKLWLSGILVALLLSACANTFAFRVRSSSAEKVGSVFVLFGKDEAFNVEQTMEGIVPLIQPTKLRSYAGYCEYKLNFKEGGAEWSQLSERLPADISLEISPKEPGVMSFELDRDLLDLHPQLGIAVVLRTDDSKYFLKAWDRAFVAEAEGTLVIDVTQAGVTSTLN